MLVNKLSFKHLGVIAGLALAVRLAYLAEMSQKVLLRVPVIDANEYFQAALAWSRGDWAFKALGIWYHGLFYPLILGVFFKLTTPDPITVFIMQSVLAAITAGLIALIAAKLFNPAAGLLAGLFAALCGSAIFLQLQILPEGLVVMLDAAALLCLIKGMQSERWWWFAAGGLGFGLSAATRSNVLAPLVIVMIMLPAAIKPIVKAVRSCLWILLPVIVVLCLTALRNRVVGGEWEPLQARGGFNFYYYNSPPQPETYFLEAGYEFERIVREPLASGIETARGQSWYFVRKTVAWIISHPGAYLSIVGHRLAWLVANDEMETSAPARDFVRTSVVLKLCSLLFGFGVIAPLAALGLLVWRRQGDVRKLAIPSLAVAGGYLLTNIGMATGMRFRLPLTFTLLPFAGEGLLELYAGLKRRASPASVGTLVLISAWVTASMLINVPQPFHTAFYEGIALEAMGQFDLAAERLHQAAAERPQSAAAWKALGNVLQKKSMHNEALDSWQHAVELTPDDPSLFTNMGVSYRRLDRYDDAERALQQALRLNPDHVSAIVNLGNLYRMQKLYDKANGVYREFLSRHPADTQVKLELAVSTWQGGDGQTAAELFRQLLQAAPDDGLVHYHYGLLLLDEQQWLTARDELRQATTLQPDLFVAWYNYGVALFKVDDLKGAIAAWERCLKLSDSFVPALANLIQAYDATGQTARSALMKKRYQALAELAQKSRKPDEE